MRYNIFVMKRLKLYLDTSIISAAIDEREPEKRKDTLYLIEEIVTGRHEAYISRISLIEINRAAKDISIKLLGVVKDINPEELEIDKATEVLAGKYISEGVIPGKYENDAVHIAVASVNSLDVVVSWNFEHMVKHKTRVEVTGINTFMGYNPIDICTPKEVIKDA